MSLSPLGLLSPALGTATVAREAASLTSNVFSKLLSLNKAPGAQNTSAPNPSGAQSALSGVDLDGLKKQADAELQSFHSQFHRLLAENGIEYGGSLHLQIDDLGQIEVANGHPQKAEIENLVKAHPELGDQLRKVAALSGVVQGAAQANQKTADTSNSDDGKQQIDAARFLEMLDESRKTQFDLRLTAREATISYIAPAAAAAE